MIQYSLPRNSTEDTSRPLATFILFTYNQERYVREAVEAAFAQTYEPLEIILSDDCSTDQTFEVLQKLANNYNGPHCVKAIKNQTNLGLMSHVIARGKQAAGKIIVMAAGDDISDPSRTEQLVSAFESNTAAVFSLVSIIDEHGKIISESVERPLHLKKPNIYIKKPTNIENVIQGCSAAYRDYVFDIPVDPKDKDYAEDLIFSFYINIIGLKIRRLEIPLVKYRTHPQALSNFAARLGAIDFERQSISDAEIRLVLINDYFELTEKLDCNEIVDKEMLTKAKNFSEIVTKWPNLSLAARVKEACNAMAALKFKQAKWCFFRVWGDFPNYQPKSYLSRYQRQYK